MPVDAAVGPHSRVCPPPPSCTVHALDAPAAAAHEQLVGRHLLAICMCVGRVDVPGGRTADSSASRHAF